MVVSNVEPTSCHLKDSYQLLRQVEKSLQKSPVRPGFLHFEQLVRSVNNRLLPVMLLKVKVSFQAFLHDSQPKDRKIRLKFLDPGQCCRCWMKPSLELRKLRYHCWQNANQMEATILRSSKCHGQNTELKRRSHVSFSRLKAPAVRASAKVNNLQECTRNAIQVHQYQFMDD